MPGILSSFEVALDTFTHVIRDSLSRGLWNKCGIEDRTIAQYETETWSARVMLGILVHQYQVSGNLDTAIPD
ncbi:MAG: hypothetical protein KMY55_01520 [Dethiosulfatibacter sp.]|nr:hypothetical protein [Dethiosulfatibacter sp.]